jgi:hypothetical protein
MRSTGEVMGLDADLGVAYAKSQMAANSPLPLGGRFSSASATRTKRKSRRWQNNFPTWDLNWSPPAARRTVLEKAGLKVQRILKLLEGRPNVIDLLKNKEIQLVINTPSRPAPRADEVKIRTTAIYTGTPIMTTLSGAKAAALGIAALKKSGYASRRCRNIIDGCKFAVLTPASSTFNEIAPSSPRARFERHFSNFRRRANQAACLSRRGRFRPVRQRRRGGEIFHVTTLDDSGAGSFRDAVSKPNRTVVFDVGGIIRLKSNVAVSSDITLAGQTAPGDGIMIYGRSVSFSGQNNVIVRYLRFREGIEGDKGKCSVNLSGGGDMIFDHCSIEWGRWDCLGLTARQPRHHVSELHHRRGR